MQLRGLGREQLMGEERANLRSVRFRSGPRKVAVACVIALGTALLWVWTNAPVLVAIFGLTAGIMAVAGLMAVQRRRRSEQERIHANPARRGLVADTVVELDAMLADGWMGTSSDVGTPPFQIRREPLRSGKGSHFLNLVELIHDAGEARRRFVEKGVDSSKGEAVFWQEVSQGFSPSVQGEHFEVVEPVDMVADDRLTVLYFPYLPALDRELRTLRKEFRARMVEVAAMVADFNGRNLSPVMDSRLKQPFCQRRPSHDLLQRHLGVTRRRAEELQRSWDAVRVNLPSIQGMVARLPQCLCHNDVSPGNVVHVDGVFRITDFGLASVGPVGSDLHSMIRWSLDVFEDPAHIENLISAYREGLAPHVPEIDMEDLRVAAWSTYFARYTDLRFGSSRKVVSFDLALARMNELIGRHGSWTHP